MEYPKYKELRFFSVAGLRQFFLNMKEFPEIAYYGSMIRKSWYSALLSSSLFIVLMPIMALALLGLATLNLYELVRAPNKNIDKWLGALVSLIAGVLTCVCIGGFILEPIFGFSFAAGPWIMFSSILLCDLNLVFNLALNLVRMFESPKGSRQRGHFFQETLQQLNRLVTMAAVTTSIACVVLFTAPAAIITLVALTTTTMIMLNLAWRFIPKMRREQIKRRLGVANPEFDSNNETMNASLKDLSIKIATQPKALMELAALQPGRTFTAPDYESQMRGLPHAQQTRFLVQVMHGYRARLCKSDKSATRVRSKINVIDGMLDNMRRLQKKIPTQSIAFDANAQLFQSFWRESEMKAIQRAYQHLSKRVQERSLDPAITSQVTLM